MAQVTTQFVVADGSLSGEKAVELCGECRYVVLDLQDGFRIATKRELLNALNLWGLMRSPFAQVPIQAFDAFIPNAVIELNSLTPAEEELPSTLEEGKRILVLDNGKPAAVLTGDRRDRDIAKHSSPGRQRWINAWMRNRQEALHDPRHTPLQVSQVYSLYFDVDDKIRPESIAPAAAFAAEPVPGGGDLLVTVRLETADFDLIGSAEQVLVVPAEGASRNAALFSVVPLRAGQVELNACFYVRNNLVQVLTLSLQVGGPAEAAHYARSENGRGFAEAGSVTERQVSLTILNQGGSYRIVLSATETISADLPLKPADVEMVAADTRAALLSIVTHKHEGKLIYQTGTTIPEQVSRETLRVAAEAGCRLYQQLFIDWGDPVLLEMGQKLCQALSHGSCKVQISSQDFVLPWGLLYLSDRLDPDDIQVEKFLGMNHIVETIPLQGLQEAPAQMDTRQGLDISLAFNTDIDRDTHYPYVDSQVKHWKGLTGQFQTLRTNSLIKMEEVVERLNDPAQLDQVLYFYCHGLPGSEPAEGGSDASALYLSQNGKLTLRSLRLYSPVSARLSGRPLVFINGCETARLSALMSDGFVRYFVAKGARGVIGAETKVPLYFALIWATRFFDRFLAGKPVGEIFLELRQEFYYQEHNLLGLLYALYLDCDTRIEPGIAPVG